MATRKAPTKRAAPAAEPPVEELEDLEVEDLEDDDIDEDALVDDEEDVLVDDDEDVLVDVVDLDTEVLTPEPVAVVERAAEDTEEEEEEEDEDEDVEASLDVILKERLVVEDEPDDEEPTDVEDRSELSERVLPKQPDEFVCRSCFLVKHPSQLADKKKMLCRDCV
jgi:hypothetical protein